MEKNKPFRIDTKVVRLDFEKGTYELRIEFYNAKGSCVKLATYYPKRTIKFDFYYYTKNGNIRQYKRKEIPKKYKLLFTEMNI